MPRFRVVLQPEAERNIGEIFTWLAERSPQGASGWYRALEQAIQRLRESADRIPVAPESQHFDYEIRHLLFRTRRGHPYRILLTRQGLNVHVVYVRGPGQDYVGRPDSSKS